MRALIFVFGSILHFSYGLTNGIELHRDYTKLKDSYNNNMYKYHERGLSWADAKAECVNEGASLFVPEDKAEMAAVLNLFQLHPTNNVQLWVGISRSFFTTIEGRPLSNETYWFGILNYSTYTPNTENCILFHDRYFQSLACTYKLYFICKYNPRVNALAQPCICNCATSTGSVQTASPQTVTPQTVTPQTVTPQTVTLQSVLCDHHIGEGNRTADHTSRSPNLFEQVISEELNKFPPSETLAVKAAIINAIVEQWQRVNGTIQETMDLRFGQET